MSKLSESIKYLASSNSRSSIARFEPKIHEIARELNIDPNAEVTAEVRERITREFMRQQAAIGEQIYNIRDCSEVIEAELGPPPEEVEE